jgi:isocitrate/isopropylmalate dehydrogenase
MKSYKIAAIPGDGIGTEVISAGVEVLHALAKREGAFSSSSIISTGVASTTRSRAA